MTDLREVTIDAPTFDVIWDATKAFDVSRWHGHAIHRPMSVSVGDKLSLSKADESPSTSRLTVVVIHLSDDYAAVDVVEKEVLPWDIDDMVRMQREEMDRRLAPILQPIADRWAARALGMDEDEDF